MVTRQHLVDPILIVAPLSTIGFWQREVERFSALYGVIYRGGPDSRKIIRQYEWKWPSPPSEMELLNAFRNEFHVDPRRDVLPHEQLPASVLASGVPLARRPYKFNVLITSYEFIMLDYHILSRLPFSALVIDEAQRLKNSSSKLFEKLLSFKITRKLLLTGTPISNDMSNLWSLLHFIEPKQFPDQDAFLRDYSSSSIISSMEHVKRLYHNLRPYVLRRLKSDVEKSLPAKQEILIEIELTRVQKKYYRAVYERNYKFLNGGGKNGEGSTRQMNSLINVSMQLRKVSQHPYLIDGCEKDELEQLYEELARDAKQQQQQQQQQGSSGGDSVLRAPTILSTDAIMEKLVSSSGKFLFLDKLLPKLRHEGHRCLIFSQMTRVLDILQDYLHYRHYKHERLDGNVGAADRQQAIDRFSAPNSDVFAFLLSTRAGGLGITLTAADTVVLFDSDWNLTMDRQAMDRAHRIGQTKEVKCYRLLTKDTYEMEMFHRACLKLTLDHVVMASLTQSGDASSSAASTALAQRNNGSTVSTSRKRKHSKGGGGEGGGEDGDDPNHPFDSKEVEDILKHGAYNIFASANAASGAQDLASMQFAEEDIDVILKRSQLLKYTTDKDGKDIPQETITTNEDGSVVTATPLVDVNTVKPAAASSFSKASFMPQGGGEELSLSDPLFWEKIGLVDRSDYNSGGNGDPAAADGGAGVIVDGKRIRKPVVAFQGSNDDAAEAAAAAAANAAASAGALRGVVERGPRTGPARCQVCQQVTHDDETIPILICDDCEDEAHLSCLGLLQVPLEDKWDCPACEREKKRAGKVREEEEGDEEYRPLEPNSRSGGRQNPVSAVAGVWAPIGSTSASALGLKGAALVFGAPLPFPGSLLGGGGSSHALTKAEVKSANHRLHREKYERLLQTYRVTYPGLTEEQYTKRAEKTWRVLFDKLPPPPLSAAAASSSSSSPPGGAPSAVSRTTPVRYACAALGIMPSSSPYLAQGDGGVMPMSDSSLSVTSSLLMDVTDVCKRFHQQDRLLESNMRLLHPACYYARDSAQLCAPLSVTAEADVKPFSLSAFAAGAAAPNRCSNTLHCSRVDESDASVPAASFLVCGRCQSARYCSKACQLADWRASHKKVCKSATVV